MAIVTISQIKHRRGIKGTDPMPQLSSAELGWAVDSQELFIGNGTIAEGAPAVGNTEILTEHSNLNALLSDYTYAGPFFGATMQTGPGPGSPVIRSNDEHEDDTVNVRSFGAVGDGVTDDLAALNRAIQQHTSNQPANSRYWTTIYVPAGTYLITSPLQLPSRTRLVGDGYNSTIISMNSGNAAVLEFGEAVDLTPEDIYLSGIGFTATQAVSHVCTMSNASNIIIDRCAFNGFIADTISDPLVGTDKACVLFQNASLPSSNIKFQNCYFNGAHFGITTDIPGGSTTRQDIHNVVVENCYFDDLWKGISCGLEVDDSVFTFPSNWRVSFSYFDNITREGIHCGQTNKFTSAANHFADVGNLQAATPTYSNIVFGDSGGVNPIDPGLTDLTAYEGCYSLGDTFARTDADDDTVRRIASLNCLSSYVIDPYQIQFGTLHQEPGRLLRLTNVLGDPVATGLSFDADEYEGVIVDYQLNIGNDSRRTGTFYFSLGQTTHAFSEDFVELASAVGVAFSTSQVGSVVSLDYTLAGTTLDCVFSYSIRHTTCKMAVPPASIGPLALAITFPADVQTADTLMYWDTPTVGLPGTIAGSGGIGPYSIVWTVDDPGLVFTDNTVLNVEFEASAAPGTYVATLTITDGNLDVVFDTATINVA